MQARIRLWGTVAILAGLGATTATAQDRAWIQVEAQPTQTEAETRADAYDDSFADVQGYRLGSRWFGIALGPYPPEEAQSRLIELRRNDMIPPDSYLTNGDNFREQFWPLNEEAAAPLSAPETILEAPLGAPLSDAPPVTAPQLAPSLDLPETTLPESAPPETAPPETAPPVAAPPVIEETPDEALRSEAALSPEQRQDLQRALQWGGFYNSGIDGAFGRGTRNSMAEWQSAMGLEPTGILTRQQRQTLVANWQADIAEFGFETVAETEAGIEITLPMGLIEFDHYEPPFAHFKAKTDGGLKVVLISQPGERGALYGLYDSLLGLTMFPADGPRNRGERGFEIAASSDEVVTHAFAETRQGLIKGYILSWDPKNTAAAEAAPRVLQQMKASFRPVGARALDPGMAPMSDSLRRGLLSGLEQRAPKATASGFYVDQTGTVATLAAPVAQCAKVTLDGRTEASVKLIGNDLALLTPKLALAPPAIASFQLQPERIGTEVTVAGYSYGDALPAPAMTFGRLEDVTGLKGETGVKRLSITTLPGDAGGPVLDGTGAVLGMVLPRPTDSSHQLPEGVEFALASANVLSALRAAGVTGVEAQANGALAPADLARKASGMTVLVSCWE